MNVNRPFPKVAKHPPMDRLLSEASAARRWLMDEAAPMWATRGRTESGLFAERIDLDGRADPSYFRVFVQARHIFSFVQIGRMGWSGPWRELTGETMDRLLRCARRPDGLFVHRIDADARAIDERADLYDQAFVLLALGTAGGALGVHAWFDEAERLLDQLERDWAAEAGGFIEGEIATPGRRRQNPHMHLLEAFLALHEASGRERFAAAAEAIVDLAERRFIDRQSGALLEYFTDTLKPAAGTEGRIAEPGHCFEWAWLFERFQPGNPRSRALSDSLTRFGRRHGLDERRNVAVNEVLTDGIRHDPTARLWPQTERLKAALARLRRLQCDEETEEAVFAARGLRRYLDVPTPGLWRDKLRDDGSWIEEPAPGSSLYHISCAYAELWAAVGADREFEAATAADGAERTS